MHISLPEGKRRVILIVSSVAAVLIVATVLLTLSDSSQKYGKNANLIPQGKEYPDRDGDGLADFEELYWGSDPENPDTDGDGTSDGIEVLNGRNPWVPGPDDSLAKYPAFPEYNDYVRETDSATDRFVRRLIVSYDEVSRRGLPLTPELEDRFTLAGYDEIKGTLPEYKAYYFKDIIIQEDDSSQAARAYGEKVANIINKNTPPGVTNEYASVIRYLETNDASYLKHLNKITVSYENIKDDLLAVSVPPSFAVEHVYLVNSIYGMEILVGLMAQIQTDPLLAHAALDEYIEYSDNLLTSYTYLNAKFVKKGVHFGPQGIASLFTQAQTN